MTNYSLLQKLQIKVSCMNKWFLLFFLLLSVHVYSKDIYYYKQTKIIRNGKHTTNVTGGQFITFVGRVCYESNNKGVSVNHGLLEKNSSRSTNEITTFIGESYWGKNTEFRFNVDRTILNVCLENGTVYVYSKATPPANQVTCSLIRPKSSSDGGGSIIVTPIPGGNNGTISGSSTNQQPRNHEQEKRDILNKTVGENCGACKGSGKCRACNGTKVAHSMGNTYTCTACDKNGNCGACNGTGKTLWNR